MMLAHLGHPGEEARIKSAVSAALATGDVHIASDGSVDRGASAAARTVIERL